LNLRADVSFLKSELADLDALFMKGLKRISEIKKKEAKEYQRLLQIDYDSYIHYLKSPTIKIMGFIV
jgi:hypothetical protein